MWDLEQGRILIVNDKYGEFGGTEEYINSFAKLFSKFGYEIFVVYGEKHPKTFSSPIVKEFESPILGRRYVKDSREVFDELHGLRRYVDGVKPDIIYLHNILDHRVVDLFEGHEKIVWYCHDHFFYCLTELKICDERPCEHVFSKNCVGRVLAGRCLERYKLPGDLDWLFMERGKLLESTRIFDRVVVISEYMRSNLERNISFLRGKICLVPRQVDVPRRIGGRGNREVLFVGRLVKEKGLHHLIEAMGFVGGGARLTVVGGGEKDYVEKCSASAKGLLEKKGLEVVFTGKKPHDEVSRFYAGASVVVVPSLFPEPFGVVAAEALAHGVPVVAYDVGGISSIVSDGETGFLVEYGNIEGLGERINYLCNNPSEGRSMGLRGREFVRREFNPGKHVNMLMEIFEG